MWDRFVFAVSSLFLVASPPLPPPSPPSRLYIFASTTNVLGFSEHEKLSSKQRVLYCMLSLLFLSLSFSFFFFSSYFCYEWHQAGIRQAAIENNKTIYVISTRCTYVRAHRMYEFSCVLIGVCTYVCTSAPLAPFTSKKNKNITRDVSNGWLVAEGWLVGGVWRKQESSFGFIFRAVFVEELSLVRLVISLRCTRTAPFHSVDCIASCSK